MPTSDTFTQVVIAIGLVATAITGITQVILQTMAKWDATKKAEADAEAQKQAKADAASAQQAATKAQQAAQNALAGTQDVKKTLATANSETTDKLNELSDVAHQTHLLVNHNYEVALKKTLDADELSLRTLKRLAADRTGDPNDPVHADVEFAKGVVAESKKLYEEHVAKQAQIDKVKGGSTVLSVQTTVSKGAS
jgi:hypothetical protein